MIQYRYAVALVIPYYDRIYKCSKIEIFFDNVLIINILSNIQKMSSTSDMYCCAV
jgi:hypothetical protein